MNIFEAKNVVCGYRDKKIIDGISFAIKQGEMLGIIGPNGAGKTTLFRCLTKALAPWNGRVFFKQKDLAKMNIRAFSKEVAVVPQVFEFPFSFNVEELVLMGRFPHLGRLEALSEKDRAIIDESLALTQLNELRNRKIYDLSGGERQMVILAQGFAQKPEVLFLDEATAHLDIAHQVKILNILKDLNRRERLTIVLVLHDLNLASEYCDRLILLDKGKISAEGSPQEVLTYQKIEEVYRTVVIVRENPISGKPFILLVSGESSFSR